MKEDFKILDFVKNFQRDFTYHAKEELKNINAFIIGARETGLDLTDLDRLRNYCLEDRTLGITEQCEEFRSSKSVFLFGGQNTRFFYGIDGKIKEVMKEEAMKIYDIYVDKAVKAQKLASGKLFITVKKKLESIFYTFINGKMYNISVHDPKPLYYFDDISGYENNGEFRNLLIRTAINYFLKAIYKRGIEEGVFNMIEQQQLLNDLKDYQRGRLSSFSTVETSMYAALKYTMERMPSMLEKIKKKYPAT